MTKRDLALDLFRSFQTGKRSKRRVVEEKKPEINNSQSRDPELLANVLDTLITERDWKSGIAEGNLFTSWREIVGAEIAEHATPITFLDGVLTLRTSSTAWAVQLERVIPEMIATVQSSAPGVLVDSIVILGPSAPSWKKGLRTIRGARGPRDTYG
jgi:predicted nucleic acid-binding Zn ribbon protein